MGLRERRFNLLQQTSAFGIISRCASPLPPSCILYKRPSSPLQFEQEENIPGHSFEKGPYWFVLKTASVFPIPTNRVEREWLTFIMVNVTPIYNRVQSKIYLLSYFSLAKTSIYLGTHLTATRVFLISIGRVERGWLTLR